ncbi:MAG TPA: M20 family metallopeptidase [Aggregatilineaceae bacterium]|nr:M20 family metallopeptidase [Aggregatilineaceae bacterium]
MKLLDFFRDHNDEIVALLEELVIHESPTADKIAVDTLGDLVVDQLGESGAQVEIFPREEVGDILYASWNGSLPGRPILLLAHLDTVWPVGTIRDMPLWQSGVRLYGPGILDMKAGIALILKVMSLLHLHGGLPRRPIWALFTTDEETGSAYSRDLIEKVAANVGLVLVFEPATQGETVKTSRRGTARYSVHIEGRPAHSGEEPEKGINAIHEAAYQILRIAEWDAPEQGTSVAVNVISGGTAPNIIAPQSEFLVDMRFARQDEATRLVGLMNDLKPVQDGARLVVRGGIRRPPMERDARMIRTYAQCAKLAGQLGLPVGEELTGAGSDANFTAALGIPTLDGLGARGEGMHAEDEHVMVTSLPRRAALLASILQNWEMDDENGERI